MSREQPARRFIVLSPRDPWELSKPSVAVKATSRVYHGKWVLNPAGFEHERLAPKVIAPSVCRLSAGRLLLPVPTTVQPWPWPVARFTSRPTASNSTHPLIGGSLGIEEKYQAIQQETEESQR